MLNRFEIDFAAITRGAERVFALMAIAEEEIEAGQLRHSGGAGAVRLARTAEPSPFLIVRPPTSMTRLVPAVYRSHARELVERIATGANVRLATEAEILLALLEGSLRAPLERAHQALAERLASRILTWSADGAPTENYPGECDELLATYRRKLAVSRS